MNMETPILIFRTVPSTQLWACFMYKNSSIAYSTFPVLVSILTWLQISCIGKNCVEEGESAIAPNPSPLGPLELHH